MKSIEIIVSGRVQGVGFRYFTVRQAQLYNILGTVRNTRDGKVKIVAVGSQEDLDLFIQEIRMGPRLGWVESVKISQLDAAKHYNNFRIEY